MGNVTSAAIYSQMASKRGGKVPLNEFTYNKLAKVLTLACEKGNVPVVERLLNHNFEDIINEEEILNKDDQNAMYLATINGHLDCVKYMLDFNVSPESVCAAAGGMNLLMAALSKKNLPMVQLLLQYDAKVNFQSDVTGLTPLHVAAEHGSVECIKELLDNGAMESMETPTTYKGWTPVFCAARYGQTDALRLLLDKGGDYNIELRNGQTAVYTAAKHGHVECLRLLLDRGAPVEVSTDAHVTPIQAAAQRGKVDCVRLLLDRGATPTDDMREVEEATAASLAASASAATTGSVFGPDSPSGAAQGTESDGAVPHAKRFKP